MQDTMDMLKALADDNRVRVMCALEGRELCVCQVIELLGLAPSTVSKHLSILRQARLVESRKNGTWVYYRVASRSRSPSARKLTRTILDALQDTWQIEEDRKKLKQILKADPEKLCRRVLQRSKR